MMVNTRDFTYVEKLGATLMFNPADRVGFSSDVPYGTYAFCFQLAARKTCNGLLS
jgi:hypothetical protein